MSFSNDCKNEILEADFSDRGIAEAFIYGLFTFASGVNTNEILITSENIGLLEKIAFCLVSIGIPEQHIDINLSSKMYSLVVTNQKSTIILLDRFDLLLNSDGYELNDSIVYTDETVKAYIIGAFLGSGTVSSPAKGYHLQFSTHNSDRAYILFDILSDQGFQPKITKNGFNTIVYFKNSSQIEDLLTYMGAFNNSLSLMELKVYKDVKNNVTRRVNCESANLQKTISSAAEDVALFQSFFNVGGEIKNEELLRLAHLRIDHPEYSFTELAELMGNSITKSGINHRLRKLRELMKEQLNNDKN